MKTKCDECDGNLRIDEARGEGSCEVCSLVHVHMSNDAETNSGTSLGEGRQNEAVNADAGHAGARMGARMNPFGDRVDGAGNRLNAQQQKRARRFGQLDRSTQRDKDPMYAQLMSTMRDMFGRDMAKAMEPLARASARKLTQAQEATRATLPSSAQDRLKCPKTSICRAGGREHPELRGATELDNLRIMSLAIASIAARWFRTVSINEQQLMAMYGITPNQLKNARKVIMQHYQQRVTQGWAAPPNQLSRAAEREDNFDKVVQNLTNALSERLTELELDMVIEAFFDNMSAIREPSVDAPTGNVPISMVAGCVVYSILMRMGLHEGNLSAVARAVGRSGAGIKSRLEELMVRFDSGEFPEGKVLFVDPVPVREENTDEMDGELADE